jgi:endo-1,4-beta-xylanase
MHQHPNGRVVATRALALSLSLTLAACGGGSDNSSGSTPAAQTPVTTTPPATTTTTTPPATTTTTTPPATTTTTTPPATTTTTPAAKTKTPVSTTLTAASFNSAGVYDAGVPGLWALAPFPIGVAVDGAGESRNLLTTTAQQTVVNRHFSQITAGNIMKMSYLHPSADTYTFDNADALVKYAADNGIAVHAHTLIWHSDYQVPSYMKSFTGDKEAFLTMLDQHVKGVASHFAGKVASWDVVNEALSDGSGYRTDSVFYQKSGNSPDYIARAFTAARAADPKAKLYYNDYSTEVYDGNKFKSLMTLLDDLKAKNAPIDGVGFQMHVYFDWPSASDIGKSFKAVADRGLMVKISELDIPVNNPYSAGYPGNVKMDYTTDIALQHKKRYCEVVKAYMDNVPAAQRGGVVIWGVDDPSSWLISFLHKNKYPDWPLLFNKDYQDKPALRGVADALTGAACTAT